MIKLAVFPDIEVDVGITAHVTLFQVTICYFYITQNFLNSLHKKSCFFRRRHIRFSYNFYKRCTTAVVVNIRVGTLQMERFTNVFLKVDSFYTYTAIFSVDNTVIALKVFIAAFCSAGLLVFRIVYQRKVNKSVCTKGNIILGNLVALGKVRIKIMLAVKFCKTGNITV